MPNLPFLAASCGQRVVILRKIHLRHVVALSCMTLPGVFTCVRKAPSLHMTYPDGAAPGELAIVRQVDETW